MLSPQTSAHNLYLLFLAEYGIIGLVLVPALVAAISWRARHSALDLIVPGGFFILFWCLFSHNVIGEYYFLIGLALLAAINAPPKAQQACDG